jgi:uncharacterized membrane protein YeaQ/YmgE (transglycosylase-associated protein family)
MAHLKESDMTHSSASHITVAYNERAQSIRYSKWIAITLVWATFFYCTSLGALALAAQALARSTNWLSGARIVGGYGAYLLIAVVFAVMVGALNKLIDPKGEKRALRNRRIRERSAGRIPTFVSLPGSFFCAAIFCVLTGLALNAAAQTTAGAFGLDGQTIGLGALLNLPTGLVGAFVTGLVLKRLQGRRGVN